MALILLIRLEKKNLLEGLKRQLGNLKLSKKFFTINEVDKFHSFFLIYKDKCFGLNQNWF